MHTLVSYSRISYTWLLYYVRSYTSYCSSYTIVIWTAIVVLFHCCIVFSLRIIKSIWRLSNMWSLGLVIVTLLLWQQGLKLKLLYNKTLD